MNYALTAIKLAGGEETPRFEAKVTLDGKLIAHVSNGGTGGCNMWHWTDRAAEPPFMAWIKANTTETIEPEDDWVATQLDKFEEAKMWMRKSLKATLIRIDGDPDDTYRPINSTDLPKVRAYLLAKYAGKNPVIFNRVTKTWDAITPARIAA